MLRTYHETKLALGSDVTYVLVADKPSAEVQPVLDNLWQQTYLFEQQFSRFITGSELSMFNRQAGTAVEVSPEFRHLLAAAKELSQSTNGIFNPMILPALQKAGYRHSFVEKYQDDEQDIFTSRAVVNAKHIEIDTTEAKIPHGTALDFGGCGKGYLADVLANQHIPSWVHGFWLSLGGDVAGQGYNENGEPWTVVIQTLPNQPTKIVQTTGQRFNVGTSGVTLRKGIKAGVNWHHIIDPRTLRPSDSDLTMATVCAQSAIEADVFATCAIILGSEQAIPFLKDRAVSAAFLQDNDSRNWEFGEAIVLSSEASVHA